MIHVAKEYTRLKVALVIPTGTPIMLEKEITDIPPLAADKTIKVLSKWSNAAIHFLVFYSLLLFLEFLQ